MDPKETLRRLRALVDHVERSEELPTDGPSELEMEFAELFAALDEWMVRKGANPWRSR